MVRAMVGTQKKAYPSCLPLKLFICIDGNNRKNKINDPTHHAELSLSQSAWKASHSKGKCLLIIASVCEKGCGNGGSEAEQLDDPEFLWKMGFVFHLEAPLGEQGFCAGSLSLSLLLILPVSLCLSSSICRR